MLSKLLKYEIKATARTFLPLYAVLIAFSLINKLIHQLSSNQDAPRVIGMTLYIITLVSMGVITLIVMIQRFYKNLLQDEGYLMFTLPTAPWMHITSKLLVSMMWMVASAIIAFISILINLIGEFELSDFFEFWTHAFKALNETFGSSTPLIIIELLLIAFLNLASGILIIYASISIGHLFNKHRVLTAFGAFLVLNTISQIIHLCLAFPAFTKFIKYDAFRNNAVTFTHTTLLYTLIISALFASAYFAISNIILRKRLNLE